MQKVSAKLRYTALVSRAVADRSAADIAALSDKIDREHEDIARDYSPASAEVLYKAVELIQGFDQRMS